MTNGSSPKQLLYETFWNSQYYYYQANCRLKMHTMGTNKSQGVLQHACQYSTESISFNIGLKLELSL